MTARPAGIAVLGAGRMGRGLAHVFAYAGHRITLIDFKTRDAPAFAALARAARDEIAGTLGAFADLGEIPLALVADILARVTILPREELDRAAADSEFLFEAVPEVLAVKQQALSRLGRAGGPDAVIASTTSTMNVDELAGFLDRPERFLNAHWLNPAFLIPLVEVSPGKATGAETAGRMLELLKSVGKVPVRCAATPGFIVPRLQALVMNEAARLVEEGVATAAEIDLATRYGLGFRFATLGVIEFIDWGGGDILYYADAYLRQALNADRFAAPAIVERHMASGAIGLKAGRGFHDYSGRDIAAYQRETLARFVALLKHYGLFRAPAASSADQHQGDVGEQDQ